MRKKILSLALALVMCLGLTVPAFAAEEKLKVSITFDGYLRTEYVKGDGENEFMAVQVVKDGSNVKLECPGAEQLAVEDEYERTLKVDCFQYTKGAGWVPISAAPFLDDLNRDVDGVIIDASTKTFVATSAGAGSAIFTVYGYNPFDVEEVYWMSESGFAELSPEFKGVPGPDSKIIGTVGPDKSSQPTVPTVGNFTDVKTTDFFAESVAWAVGKGVTDGVGNNQFLPGRTCTNGEIITFLWRAAGEPQASAQAPITANYAGFADAINWAYEQGVIDASFQETADCTRTNTVTYIWKAKGSPAASGSNDFTDVPANADYAQAVNWAVGAKVTAGTGNGSTFSPANTCTRGEIVTFLYRAFAE